MSEHIITVFEAVGPYDTTEGRSPGTISYGFFRNRGDAILEASDKGVMGTMGQVEERRALLLQDHSIFVFTTKTSIALSVSKVDRERLIASALSKLTEAEKMILGLKP